MMRPRVVLSRACTWAETHTILNASALCADVLESECHALQRIVMVDPSRHEGQTTVRPGGGGGGRRITGEGARMLLLPLLLPYSCSTTACLLSLQ